MKSEHSCAVLSLQSRIIMVLLLLCSAGMVAAETVYVSDTLRVGVRNEPLNNVPPVGVVITGMKLEVLDERDGFVKVRSDKGLEGWVRDIYVTRKPPAVIRLETLEKQNSEIDKTSQELKQELQTLQQSQQALVSELEQTRQEKNDLLMRQAREADHNEESSAWGWWLSLVVLLMAGAFAAGMLWYRQQITRRLGGLKL